MRFGLLGPLEVRTDEKVLHLGGAKQRALLAILLIHANEVVSRDRLLEEIWPDRPPGDAAHSLDHQISRLRKARSAGPARHAVGRLPAQRDPGDIDLHRFEEHLERGRQANTAGSRPRLSAALDAALGLWRGPALADVVDEPSVQVEANRLEELRLTALEERIDAQLALGEHHRGRRDRCPGPTASPARASAGAIDACPVPVGSPGRGATRVRRRQAGARRRAWSGARTELQRLEQAILRQDPSLAAPRRVRLGRRGRIAALLAVPLDGGRRAGVVLLGGGTGAPGADCAIAQCGRVRLDANRQGVRPHRWADRAASIERSSAVLLEPVRDRNPEQDRASDRQHHRQREHRRRSLRLAAGEGAIWVSDCSSPTVVRIDPGTT